jgi:hypothetical protein
VHVTSLEGAVGSDSAVSIVGGSQIYLPVILRQV